MKVYSINIMLVIFSLAGIYTYAGIYIDGQMVVPVMVGGIGGMALLLLNSSRIRKRHVRYMGVLLLLSTLSIILTTGGGFFWDKFRGLALLIYSILISYGVYLGVSRMNRFDLERVLYIAIVMILVGCFFETYLGLRLISDSFREAVHQTYLYQANDRDISMFGAIRPKLFTAEPSYVATFFVTAITAWLVVAASEKKYVFYVVAVSLALLLTGSPMVLLAVINGTVIYIFQRKKRSTILLPLRYVLASIFTFILLMIMLTTVLATRIEAITSGRDDSFNLRVIAPVYMTLSVLREKPLFGSGLSGSEAVQSNIVEGAIAVNLFRVDASKIDRVQNTFWLVWLFFGLLGGPAVFYLMYKFINSFEVGNSYRCAILLLILSQAGLGAPHAPRYWFFMMILLAALEVAQCEIAMREGID
jgi:hypothetical protein